MRDALTIPDFPLTQEQIDQYRRDGSTRKSVSIRPDAHDS